LRLLKKGSSLRITNLNTPEDQGSQFSICARPFIKDFFLDSNSLSVIECSSTWLDNWEAGIGFNAACIPYHYARHIACENIGMTVLLL
jgi:hypothetical protein